MRRTGVPGGREFREYMRSLRPPVQEVNLFRWPLLAAAVPLLPLATVVRCLGLPPVFFPERRDSASQSKHSTSRIQVTDTDQGAEAGL
jgi:hypothetical protein